MLRPGCLHAWPARSLLSRRRAHPAGRLPPRFVPAATNLLMPHASEPPPPLPYGPARKPANIAAKIKGSIAGGTSVLVGALRGSLYALPADHLVLDALADHPAALPLPGGGGGMRGKCTDCAVPGFPGSAPFDGVLAEGACAADRGSAGACPSGEGEEYDNDDDAGLAVRDDAPGGGAGTGALVPLSPSDADVAGELGGLVCPQLPLGLYELAEPGAERQALPWLPDALPAHALEVGGAAAKHAEGLQASKRMQRRPRPARLDARVLEQPQWSRAPSWRATDPTSTPTAASLAPSPRPSRGARGWRPTRCSSCPCRCSRS